MGLRGPVGLRSDQETFGHHRTKADLAAVTKAPAGRKVLWPGSLPTWEPEARQMYEGLKASGQAQFFEQSDVAVAFFLACQTQRFLEEGGRNGQMFSAIMGGWTDLLATESSRRRLRIELQRDEPKEEVDPVALIMAQYAQGTKKKPAAEQAA